MEKVSASFFPLVIAVSQSPEQSEGKAWQSLLPPPRLLRHYRASQRQNEDVIASDLPAKAWLACRSPTASRQAGAWQSQWLNSK